MSDKAKEAGYVGWYVGVVEYETNEPIIEVGPLSKSAANQLYREFVEKYTALDNPYILPVWCMSGRAMKRELIKKAEILAGWDDIP